MATIEKKIWPEWFEKIRIGEKNADLRLADFDCNPGDMIVFKEFNPKTNQFTGRTIEKTVQFVVKTKGQKWYSKQQVEKHGFQVISWK